MRMLPVYIAISVGLALTAQVVGAVQTTAATDPKKPKPAPAPQPTTPQAPTPTPQQ